MKITGTQVKQSRQTIEVKELKIEFSRITATDENGNQFEITVRDTVNEINPNVMFVRKSGAVEFRSKNLEIKPTQTQTNTGI